MRRWCAENIAACSPRAIKRSSPDKRGSSEDHIRAIVGLKSRNPCFGCPRIALITSRTFSVHIDWNVVRRVLSNHYREPRRGSGPLWLSFIGHAQDNLWSVDLFRCKSIVLHSYWMIVVIDQYTRRIVGFGVQCGSVDGPALCGMLGPEQKRELIDMLTTSDATWQLWGNQTLNSTCTPLFTQQLTLDDWSGFMAERREILEAAKRYQDARHEDQSNFVIFTGDLHTSLIAYSKTYFGGAPLNLANQDYKALAGAEFMTPSVTSSGLSEAARQAAPAKVAGFVDDALGYVPVAQTVARGAASVVEGGFNLLGGAMGLVASAADGLTGGALSSVGETVSHGAHQASLATWIKANNRHIEHFDSWGNGYAIAEFTRHEMSWTVFDVTKTEFEEVDGRKVSTSTGSTASILQTATYDPTSIKIDD